jgi:hypothetical protein
VTLRLYSMLQLPKSNINYDRSCHERSSNGDRDHVRSAY